MTATAATLAGVRRLYVVAGLAAFLAMLANVVDIVFSRINAWAGIAGFSLLTLFTFVDPASSSLFERVSNLRLESLHPRDPGRHFAVRHERLLKIALTECCGDFLEMGFNLARLA